MSSEIRGQRSEVRGQAPGDRHQAPGFIRHSSLVTRHSSLRSPTPYPLPPTTCHLPPTTCHPRTPRAGLTLIELLAALTIFVILVGLLAVTLNTASDTWRETRARSRLLTQGRAVMEVFVRDLRPLVAFTNAPLELGSSPYQTYGTTNEAIQFCHLLPTPDTTNRNYALEAVRYDLSPTNGGFCLLRWNQRLPLDTPWLWPDLTAPLAPESAMVLAEGVAALRFQPPPPAVTNGTLNGSPNTLTMPPYLDVYLELLSPEDAATAGGMTSPAQQMFVERRIVRLCRRVYLPACNRWELP